jgi:GntR family transcriptional regulator/MocR family aminotransferase
MLALDRASAVPMHRQLYQQVRQMIVARTLMPAMRLQSTRSLAAELGVSRNTVMLAFEQLHAEGLLEGSERAGTAVASQLPPSAQDIRIERTSSPPAARPFRKSRLGEALTRYERTDWRTHSEFSSGLPDYATFPYEVWTRLYRRIWNRPSPDTFRTRDPMGYLPLREAICRHLRTTRGLNCEPGQVLVTSGTANSIDTIARLFMDPGDGVWLEEPGYLEARFVLTAAQAQIAPVRVDAEGIDVAAGVTAAPNARMAVVSPSHQFPLGSTLSLARREALLAWARDADAWVLEDDYDSEFRYGGPTLPPLQSMDRHGRVFYMGTFSKSVMPNLRLAYVVVPPALAGYVAAGRARLDGHTSLQAQPVLASFIDEGHLATHLRRMRRLYASRQKALLAAVQQHLPGLIEIEPDSMGIHLVGYFTPAMEARMNDQVFCQRAAELGVTINPLSRYYLCPPARQGLIFGYASMSEPSIARKIAQLSRVVAS